MIGQIVGTGGYAAAGQMAYDRAATLGGNDVRQAEIPHQMSMLEGMLKGCLQGLDTLDERLGSTVMRSQPPMPCTDPKPQAVPNTPYGARLQELVSAAEMVNERIHSLTARLEI
jgi:hypothetical protein